MTKTFRLAPMSPLVLVMTLVLLLLPVGFVAAGFSAAPVLLVPGVLMAVTYALVWLWFRPGQFTVRPDAVEIVWPLRRHVLPRTHITEAKLIDPRSLREETGWGLRLGAGGLWGGFGWLWTSRRGIVRMYVSRADGFVWLECDAGQPWLITPERPEDFIAALAGKTP